MNTTDGRHERHMMRQRGAGARSIPTNFGFIFQAGPIQLSASTPTESPLPTNASLPTTQHSEARHAPELPRPAERTVPNRKRLVREDEEEDQVWFSKRSKKTSTAQKDESLTLSTGSGEAALEKAQPHPPTETKPLKRKTVRKRILVPKPRQKAPPQPQLDQPSVSSEPAAEDTSRPKKKTRAKAAAVSTEEPKHADNPAALLPVDDQDNELSNHPPQHKSTKKPRLNDDDIQETANSKKRPKPVVRKKVVRKDTQEDVKNEQPSLNEDTNTKMIKFSPPPENEAVEERPKKVAKKRRVAKKQVENPVQEETMPKVKAIVANPTEDQPSALHQLEKPADEPAEAEKKRKLVKRVRVPRVIKTEVGPEKYDRTGDSTTKDEPKGTRQRRRLPLEEGTSNSTPPKKSETSLNAEGLPDKKTNTREGKTKQLKTNKAGKIEETVSEDASLLPTKHKSLHQGVLVATEAEDADLALFETEAPALATKKATKAPKRDFDDDSEIDLDQMLSGIAAMAGTGAAKPSVTKSARVTKRRAAAP